MAAYAHNGKISRDPIAGGIEITDAQYAEALDGILNGLEVSIEGGFKVGPPAPKPESTAPQEPEPVKTLAELKAQKLFDINDLAQKLVDKLTAEYPAFEIQTWDVQKAEAVAWHADPTAATPVIDRMAERRGLDRETYLARTYARVQAFLTVYDIVGDRQYYVDRLNEIGDEDTAPNRDAVAGIAITYPRG